MDLEVGWQKTWLPKHKRNQRGEFFALWSFPEGLYVASADLELSTTSMVHCLKAIRWQHNSLRMTATLVYYDDGRFRNKYRPISCKQCHYWSFSVHTNKKLLMCFGVLHENYSAQAGADGRITLNIILVNTLRGREVIIQKWPDLMTGFVVTTEHRMRGNNDSILLPILGHVKFT